MAAGLSFNKYKLYKESMPKNEGTLPAFSKSFSVGFWWLIWFITVLSIVTTLIIKFYPWTIIDNLYLISSNKMGNAPDQTVDKAFMQQTQMLMENFADDDPLYHVE